MPTLNIGKLTLESPVFMAPMAGYADLAFRRCLRTLGGLGLAYTPLLNPVSLVRGVGEKRAYLLASHPDDQPLGYQLYGRNPELIAEGAKWLEDHGAVLVDINMGCPQRRIVTKGRGASLLKEPELAVNIVRQLVAAVSIPVTAKMRLGWNNTDTAVELTRAFEEEGAASVTIHGRSRAQGFSGEADLDAMRLVVEAADKMPVIANGDIKSVEGARAMFAQTGCAGVMLGRYPLKNPWIIRDIATDLEGKPPLPVPTKNEWIEFVTRHYEYSVELYGERAPLLFRKWLPRYAAGSGIPREELARIIPT